MKPNQALGNKIFVKLEWMILNNHELDDMQYVFE